MNWDERITEDKNVLGGRPAIKGTRLPVAQILQLMAAGSSEESLLAGYPQLCTEDARACLRYAGERLEPQEVSEFDRWIQGDDDESQVAG